MRISQNKQNILVVSLPLQNKNKTIMLHNVILHKLLQKYVQKFQKGFSHHPSLNDYNVLK